VEAKALTFYLDSLGEEVVLTEAYARGVLRLRLPREQLVRYLIVNLGWVEIITDQSSLIVRCRPSKLSGPTLAALYYVTAKHHDGRIWLDAFGRDWTRRYFPSFQSFLLFMIALCPANEGPDPWGESKYIRLVQDAKTSPFTPVINQIGIVAANTADPNTSVRFLERLLPARWSIFNVDTEKSTSLILAMSGDFCRFDPIWHAVGNGARITDFGDRAYGTWIANHHRLVSERMHAAHEHVDAIVNLPKLGDMRLRYQCLTLPVALQNGSRLLVCGAIDDVGSSVRQTLH
jgi:hypothetical protein